MDKINLTENIIVEVPRIKAVPYWKAFFHGELQKNIIEILDQHFTDKRLLNEWSMLLTLRHSYFLKFIDFEEYEKRMLQQNIDPFMKNPTILKFLNI